MKKIIVDKLLAALPVIDRSMTAEIACIDQPEQRVALLTHAFVKLPAGKAVSIIGSVGEIDALEMAEILASLGYSISDTAQALYDNYDNLSATELVLILKSVDVYPQTTRNEMIQTIQGVGYDISTTLTAVNPAYPAFKVLNYTCGGATLSAKPSEYPNESVFYYHNTRNPEKWDWQLDKTTIAPILNTGDVSVIDSSDTVGRGLFAIGKHKKWYYDIELFPKTDQLYSQILSLLAYSNDQQATFFCVDAKKKWQSTGVQVKADRLVAISYYRGLWTANPNDNQGKLYNSAGNPTFIAAKPGYALPGANEGALIGKVGDTVFLIGLNATVPDNLEGELLLCINDDLNAAYGDGFADNKGEIMVNIVS